MLRTKTKLAVRFLAAVALVAAAATANAVTLRVNCGGRSGLNSVGAALRVLPPGPATIQVSGNCRENVLIQSIDRLTLTALKGASISDASGGTLSVVDIEDSRDVAIKGFAINAGSGENAYGVVCGDWSSCRLSANVIQGALGAAGFAVFGQSQAHLEGDILQNNGVGLFLRSGSKVSTGLEEPFTSRNNRLGISIGRQGFAFIDATVENNSEAGVEVLLQSTAQLSGSISGNGGVGAHVSEGSVVRFNSTISGNAGAGVLVRDLSIATFVGASVTGNGGTDVECEPQVPVTRGVADTGGTTNCVEP